jgi:hypothetical protein
VQEWRKSDGAGIRIPAREEEMKKMFSLLMAMLLVLSFAGVVLAAETGSAPAKAAGEEMKNEAGVATPAQEMGKEGMKEAEPAKGEEAMKEMAPAATAAPAEKK